MASEPTPPRATKATSVQGANAATTVRRFSFFKVMLGDFAEKLRIPPAFTKHFNGKVPHESILISPTGKVWHIKVEKIGNDLFFQNGWPEFVERNLLQIGEMLVFMYQGNSEFAVKLFGTSGCEKEEASMEENEYECRSYEEEKEQSKERELFFKSIDSCQCTFSNVKHKMQSDACPFKLKYPHYTATWRSSKLYNMPVPKFFVDAIGMRTKSWVFLHDPKGRRWRVNVISLKNRVLLGSGWSALAQANGLEEGNVCGIECICGHGRGARRVMQVHIFRAGR